MLRFASLLLIAVFAVLLNACNAEITRNEDRSFNISVTLPEETIQSEIAAAVAESQLENVSVNLENGFIAVSGERPRLNGNQRDEVSFQLQLDAIDGQLVATISGLQVNGQAADDARVDEMNERIAERLTSAGQNRPNSRLEAIEVSADAVTMTWRVEPRNP